MLQWNTVTTTVVFRITCNFRNNVTLLLVCLFFVLKLLCGALYSQLSHLSCSSAWIKKHSMQELWSVAWIITHSLNHSLLHLFLSAFFHIALHKCCKKPFDSYRLHHTMIPLHPLICLLFLLNTVSVSFKCYSAVSSPFSFQNDYFPHNI